MVSPSETVIASSIDKEGLILLNNDGENFRGQGGDIPITKSGRLFMQNKLNSLGVGEMAQ